MRGYLKCVAQNRFTLAGYLCWLLYLAGRFSLSSGGVINAALSILFLSGLFLLTMTAFGLETHHAYRRARRHLLRNETADERYAKKATANYCQRVGFDLAVREAAEERKAVGIGQSHPPTG